MQKAREEREDALLKAQAEREVAEAQRKKEIEAKEAELRAEREVKEAEYKAMMEKREAERQAAVEARKRQIEEERELAEQARLQREADYQAKLAIAKQEQEEAAAKKAEYEKERNVTNFLFLRLLKAILKDQRHIESLKQLLFSHRGFSINEAFSQLDTNEDGLISGKEIQDVLTKYDFDVSNMDALIQRLNKDHEVEISYSKFQEVVTPMTKYPRNAGGYEGTFEQKETQKMAWLESLLDVLTAALSGQANHDALCEKFMLKGEDIFNDMDHYKVGYVTSAAFARWIQSNCQFTLSEADLAVLQPIFDDNRDNRITREEFLTAVCAPELQEDDEAAVPVKAEDQMPEKAPEAKPAAATKAPETAKPAPKSDAKVPEAPSAKAPPK